MHIRHFSIHAAAHPSLHSYSLEGLLLQMFTGVVSPVVFPLWLLFLFVLTEKIHYLFRLPECSHFSTVVELCRKVT